MKKNFLYFLMAAVTFMFAACTTSDGVDGTEGGGDDTGNTETPVTPPAEPELEANTYSFDGVVASFNSVAFANAYGFLSLSATPQANVPAGEIADCDEYLQFMVKPELAGSEFDLMTETKEFFLESWLAVAEVSLSQGYVEAISAGKATFTLENDVATVKAEMTLADGKVFKFHISAEAAAAPAPTPELEANTYAVNGNVAELKSVALAQMDEYIYLVGTPTAGVASANAMFECDEYVYFLVGPALVGKEFDLMTETSTFTVMSTLSGATIEGLAATETSEITAGKATFTYENSVATVKADLTLANGTTLKLHMSAEQQVVVNENTISRGDEEKPLRAAFYAEEEGITTFYFTPGEIDYFTEIYDVTWFTYISVPTSYVNGEKQTLGESTLMMFGMSDNMNYDNYVDIYGDDLQGATGDYTISKKGEGQYAVNYNITVNGVLYKASFDGTCVSMYAEPEKKTNYLKYGGEEYAVSAATFTEGNELYTFTFTTSLGKDIVLTAPDSAFGGDSYGFSQSEKFTVTFDGKTYSKANGDNGTMTAYYKTFSQTLELQFTDYNGFEFNYTGSVTAQ